MLTGKYLVDEINANAPMGKVLNGALAAAIIAESNSRKLGNFTYEHIHYALTGHLSANNTDDLNCKIINTNAVKLILDVLSETEDLLNQNNVDSAASDLTKILTRVKKELERCDL